MVTKRNKLIKSEYYKLEELELRTMKEATFSIIERILLVGIFNQKEKGMDIETLRSVLEDVKEISISDEEKKEINLRDIPGAEGAPSSLAWDKPLDKSIKLSDKTVKYVLDFIKAKSDAKELAVGDAPLLEIESKLK